MAQDQWKANAATWKSRYPTSELQAEFFLLKFQKHGDFTRSALFDLLKQFKTFDKQVQGELEEDQAMHLLESRNQTKTFRELRSMVAEIDLDQNRKLSFLEWACAIFSKSWQELHSPSVDPEEVAAALRLQEQAQAALEQAARDAEATAQMEALKLQEQEEAERYSQLTEQEKKDHDERVRRRKEELERIKREEEEERQRTTGQAGVKGSAAKFHYAAKDTVDTTAENAARLKAEAAARREKKRLEEEKVKADALAAVKAEEARLASIAKAEAEAEAEKARLEAEKADEERKKAESGSEAQRAEREAYEAAKHQAEEEARRKKEEEEAKRNAGRNRLAEKAALWNAKKE